MRRQPRHTGGRPPKVTDEQLLSLVTRGSAHGAARIRREAMSRFQISRTTTLTRLNLLAETGKLRKTYNTEGLAFYQTP